MLQYFAPSSTFRLRRAHDQIKLLANEVAKLVPQSGSYPVREELSYEGGDVYRWTIFPAFMIPPEIMWSVLISEIVHNLRAALDNLACTLADRHSGSDCEVTEFPIFGSPDGLVNARKRRSRTGDSRDPLLGMHPDAQAIIEGLQPHHRGNDYPADPLWVLYELSNIDKHRLFHITTWATIAASFQLDPGQDVEVLERGILHERGIVDENTPLAYALLRVSRVNAIMEVQMQFPPDIAFDQASRAAPGRRVGEVLCELLVYVTGIVESFEAFAPSAIYVHRTSGFQPTSGSG